MICKGTVKSFCCEDISLIENYDKAIISNEMWDCHHRLEIQNNIITSKSDLIKQELYYNRPASELIFLTKADHRKLHISLFRKQDIIKSHKQTNITKQQISNTLTGKSKTESHKQHMRKPKQKYKWLTPDGKIVLMSVNHARRYHPDWTIIGEA